jgi:hypothetical protein
MTLLVLAESSTAFCQDRDSNDLTSVHPTIWADTPGNGFARGAQQLTLSAGAGFGMKVITSRETHDWWLSSLEYGWVFTDLVGRDHWYRGNWELLAQLFGGQQFYPDTDYVIGGGPLFRYNFATGHRWTPFIDLGGGVAATSIRDEDLSTTFEFNLQGGAGSHFFIRDNLAFTLQYRFIHLSNAGIKFPNTGLNTSTFLAGITWFF